MPSSAKSMILFLGTLSSVAEQKKALHLEGLSVFLGTIASNH
jgi:hypothetical protein